MDTIQHRWIPACRALVLALAGSNHTGMTGFIESGLLFAEHINRLIIICSLFIEIRFPDLFFKWQLPKKKKVIVRSASATPLFHKNRNQVNTILRPLISPLVTLKNRARLSGFVWE